MTDTPADSYWIGPTYEFDAGEWRLVTGVPAEGGRLEWLLRHLPDGVERSSHSFVLDPHATREDLESALADLPPEVLRELVDQVVNQSEPRLLSVEGDDSGLA